MQWKVLVRRNIPWSELQTLEKACFEEVHLEKSTAYLIVSEPTPTYTFGRNSTPQDLLWTEERLAASGAEVHSVARGGKWTYHGPGQILFFPILHLPSQGFSKLGVHAFMDQFRRSAQVGLKASGIASEPKDEPFGLYVGEAKLASFGVHFSRGISQHGMAVYVTPQQERFRAIHPCGVLDASYTSVEELQKRLTWTDVAETLTEHLKMGLKSL